jgi:hypothetical protein
VAHTGLLGVARGLDRRKKATILILLFLICAVAIWTLAPSSQPADFFDLAARENFLGVDNAPDVFTNIPFVIVGWMGCQSLIRDRGGYAEGGEMRIWWVLFVSIGSIAILSSWYHLSPSEGRIVFDRLPIITVVIAMTTLVAVQSIDVKATKLILPLLLLGWSSVVLIFFTGDWRPYIILQFSPLILIPSILILYEQGREGGWQLCTALLLFSVGKIIHDLDTEIHQLTGGISGHSIWHLFAAAATYQLVQMHRIQSSQHNEFHEESIQHPQ